MGAYVAKFLDGNMVSSSPKISEASWITEHSGITGLSIVEVERLWVRFRQLGANSDGSLVVDGVTLKNWFSGKVFTMLQDTRGEISFKTFIAALKWWEALDYHVKLDVIFYVLNEGYSINEEKWNEIMQNLLPEKSGTEIQELAALMIGQVDQNGDGKVDKLEFITYFSQLPSHVLQDLLDFHIVPLEISEQAQKIFGPQFANTPRTKPVPGVKAPSDPDETVPEHMLRVLAEHLEKRDWPRLANALGFTSPDIDGFKAIYPDTSFEQVHAVLKTWRDKERKRATVNELEDKMNQAGLEDLSPLLRPTIET